MNRNIVSFILLNAIVLALMSCSGKTGNSVNAETDSAMMDVEPSDAAPLITVEPVPGDILCPENDTCQFEIYEKYFRIDSISEEIAGRIVGVSFCDDSPVKLSQLRYLTLAHHDGHGNIRLGEMICHETIAKDLIEIFIELLGNGYPIEKILLIDDYEASDSASMEDNNSSCFNVRNRIGQHIHSRHAYGMAVDINPLYNPFVRSRNGVTTIQPISGKTYADRTEETPYRIVKGDACYNAFVSRGFRWGGSWKSSKDYQHFEK